MEKVSTIWLTGLSGSGKSTLAKQIENYFKYKGKKNQILDGDVVRSEINNLFGYSREERIKAAKVLRLLAKLLNQNHINVIIAAIAPFEEIRELNRKNLENYIEVYVNCPVEECINRDIKGLYQKALNGEVKNFVGIDQEFEIPKHYDIEVNTDIESIDESMRRIKEFLDSYKF